MLTDSDLVLIPHDAHPDDPQRRPIPGELRIGQARDLLSTLMPGTEEYQVILAFWEGISLTPASPLTRRDRDASGHLGNGAAFIEVGPWRYLPKVLSTDAPGLLQALRIDPAGSWDEIEWPSRIVVPARRIQTWSNPDSPWTIVRAPAGVCAELRGRGAATAEDALATGEQLFWVDSRSKLASLDPSRLRG